ncbi:MAG: sensor histidine kinase [Vulcanimicrobiaceae bacterium]
MFRSLAFRLTATYVCAAFVLVAIVAIAITVFSLAMFGVATRTATEAAIRQAPEEVRTGVENAGTLAAAAPEIVRHLARPGLHVVLFAESADRREHRFLAATGPVDANGNALVTVAGRAPAVVSTPPPFGWVTPSAPIDHRPHYLQMQRFPLGLNVFLRLAPQRLEVPGGLIVIFPDPGPLERSMNLFWLAMLPIGLFVIGASWLVGRAITNQALRPLKETTAALQRFSDGDFTPRPVETTDRSEIGELVRAYNAAAAQVSDAFEERRAAEAQMRQFVADAGHELRTPLTVIMGFIDVLRRRSAGDAGSAKIFETMYLEGRRMRALVDKLIVLARMENPLAREREEVDLSALAARVVTALQVLGSRPRIALAAEPGVVVSGYELELHEALSNLVENALKYAPDSPVDVRVRRERDRALVEVRDRGAGIPDDEQALVFERFYRGRNRGETEGSGLGLAIVKRAVERSGGELLLESAAGEGTRIAFAIPLLATGEAQPIAV